jgi:hypothetical protein
MADHLRRIANLVGVAALAAALLAMSPGRAQAQQDQIVADGSAEYEESCAACHGPTGKGDGRMAEILLIPPTDLTVIRKANGGVFPFWRMYRIIEGQEELRGHMSFQMPFWLSRFKRDEGKIGFPPAYIRILTLTHYLESIQED